MKYLTLVFCSLENPDLGLLDLSLASLYMQKIQCEYQESIIVCQTSRLLTRVLFWSLEKSSLRSCAPPHFLSNQFQDGQLCTQSVYPAEYFKAQSGDSVALKALLVTANVSTASQSCSLVPASMHPAAGMLSTVVIDSLRVTQCTAPAVAAAGAPAGCSWGS